MGRGSVKRALIAVGGPTGSGKSALALRVAKEFGGNVINADAMQVYEGLAILTNRPSPEDEARLPHRLYGFLSPTEACSAGRWRELARAECDTAWEAGRLPILVGGTGLYIRALLGGLAPIPPIPEAVRARTRESFRELGNSEFHARLAARDPEMGARLHPGDSQRLMRAWEVIEATGISLARWQARRDEGGIGARAFGILAAPPMPALYAACDARFRVMVERGAIGEVRALLARKLDPALPAMKALGVRELARHIEGEIGLEEAVALAQRSTRNYAKRQATWFRHQWTPDLTVPAQFSESFSNDIFTKIRQYLLTTAG